MQPRAVNQSQAGACSESIARRPALHAQWAPASAPDALADPIERRKRQSMLNQERILPLVDYIKQQQRSHYEGVDMPCFDPCDGGVSAKVLFLLEAPGPKAVISTFISRDNPDPSARNLRRLLYDAGILREDTLLWNIVPWYVGEPGKIGHVSRSDIDKALPFLEGLLEKLKRLQIIALLGRRAQSARPQIEEVAHRINPDVQFFQTWHPSVRALGGPESKRRKEAAAEFKRISKALS